MGVLSLSATASAAAAAAAIQFQQQSPLLIRGLLPATRRGGAFPITTRTPICFPQRRLVFFGPKSGVESSSTTDELQDFRFVPSNVLTAEKEEAEAVVTMFLKKEIGLNNEAAAATIAKSVPFIDHLVARLHSVYKTRYLVERELTTLEIRDALIPYLEYLCQEHGDSLLDVIENFPNKPDKEHEDHRYSLGDVVENFPNLPEEEEKHHISEASPTNSPLHSKKLKAMARMTEIGTDGQLHPNTLYLIDIGLDMDQIKKIARKDHSITTRSLERKIKPLVEFLLDVGVPPLDIPKILCKQPRLCSLSLSENIIPSMAYLETLGLDKSKWAKVIHRCPQLLTHSRQKVEATVDYLYELGLPRNRIGKFLTRYPQIMTYSIDDNLRPTAEYFQSMGVNRTSLLSHYPYVFGRSIECQLKPVTEFFLDKGYSIDEIGTIASGYGSIYSLSLIKNLIPKWDFFLTMNYPRSELVKHPKYFGYSLEGRIKQRYAQMKECGVKLSLSTLLCPTDSDFEKLLNRSLKKRLVGHHNSINVTSDDDRRRNLQD